MTARTRLLLVEDDLDLATGIGEYLAGHGLDVDFAYSAAQARQQVTAAAFDLLVLDVNLPGQDGIALCRELKHGMALTAPVIFLTARGALDDKLRGFDAGGVDYMVKPFAPAELLARIRAITAHIATSESVVLTVEGYTLDLRSGRLSLGLHHLQLHAAGLVILRRLMQAHPRSVSRQRLCDDLWGDESPQSEPLRAHVYHLRQTMQMALGAAPITTVRGIGYRFGASP